MKTWKWAAIAASAVMGLSLISAPAFAHGSGGDRGRDGGYSHYNDSRDNNSRHGARHGRGDHRDCDHDRRGGRHGARGGHDNDRHAHWRSRDRRHDGGNHHRGWGRDRDGRNHH
ncbi:MAG: hypothetical protein ABL996_09925 [Micropepsaceae bacterium]